MKTYQEMYLEIKNYVPSRKQEKKDQEIILTYFNKYQEKLFSRETTEAHLTASAIVFDETFTKVLFAYHNIYQSYAWLGGHADNNYDLGEVATKEVEEESGLKNFKMITNSFVSLEILKVLQHFKKGKLVLEHLHLNVTYIFLASSKETIRIKEDENSAIAWINIKDLDEVVKEDKMKKIYHKIIEKSLKFIGGK